MSEPGPPYLFIFGADVVPNIYGDYWDGVVFVEYHVQAVGQCVFIEGDGNHLE